MPNKIALEVDEDSRGVILTVRAHPAARRNAILGVRNGALRVAVTAAPEKGKANRAIITVLSGALGLPKSAIELVAGETTPQKRFLISGTDAQEIGNILAAVVENAARS